MAGRAVDYVHPWGDAHFYSAHNTTYLPTALVLENTFICEVTPMEAGLYLTFFFLPHVPLWFVAAFWMLMVVGDSALA